MVGSGVGGAAGRGSGRDGRLTLAALAVAVALLLAAPTAGPAAFGPERGDLAVRSVTTNGPVLAGDPVVATAVVENRGDRPAAGTVRLVADRRVDAARIRLAPGERATVRLRWATADAGRHAVAVELGDDRTTATATVADELVGSCRSLDAPGVYALRDDVGAGGASPCLAVRADGVTLVGGGHAVTGGGAPGAGVRVGPSAGNATVRGLVVAGWRTGVAVAGDDATVRAVTATDNAEAGVALAGGDGARVTATTLSGNRDGLVLADADGAVARNLTVTDSDRHGVGTAGEDSTRGRLVNVTVNGSGGAAVDAGAAVDLRGERVRVDGADLAFVLTRARIAGAGGDPADRPPLPGDATAVGPAVDVEIGVDGRATVTLRYGDRAASRVVEPTLEAWRHDGRRWTPVGGRVDAGANALTTDVAGDGVVVAAGERNDPPAVSVTATPDRAGVGQRVTIDASGTADPEERGVATYAWDLDGDGSVDRRTTAPRTTHAYGSTGTRTVGVAATDVDGGTATSTVDVVVVPADGSESTSRATDGGSRAGGIDKEDFPNATAVRTTRPASERPAADGSDRGVVGETGGVALVVVALLALLAVLVRDRW